MHSCCLHVAEICKLRKISGNITYDNETMTATVDFLTGSNVKTECQVDKLPYVSCKLTSFVHSLDACLCFLKPVPCSLLKGCLA